MNYKSHTFQCGRLCCCCYLCLSSKGWTFFIAKTTQREKARLSCQLVNWTLGNLASRSFPGDQESFWTWRLINAPEIVWDSWQGNIRVLGTSIQEWPRVGFTFLILWVDQPDKKLEGFFLHLVFSPRFKTPLDGSEIHSRLARFRSGLPALYLFILISHSTCQEVVWTFKESLLIRQNYGCIQSTRRLINESF